MHHSFVRRLSKLVAVTSPLNTLRDIFILLLPVRCNQDHSGERFRMRFRSSRAFVLYTLCVFKQYHNDPNSLTSLILATNLLALALLEKLFLLSKNLGV
jgi:hypothetical protein